MMLRYSLKRLGQAVPLVLIVTIITFTLIQLAPYDAIDSITTPNMSKETIQLIRQQQGVDKPVVVQYFYWLKNIFQGDFGYSLVGHRDIAQDLLQKIPNTISLILPAYLAALVFAIYLGIYAGKNRERFSGRLIDRFCSIGIATPTFWVAMMFIYFFGYRLHLLPIAGMRTVGVADGLDLFKHYLLPFSVLVLGFIPDLARYVRSATITQLKQEYVTTQKAFRASKHELLWKHVFRNVLIPVVIQIGFFFPMLITGAIITESIFSWPGVGNFFLTAAKSLDYPVIMAIVCLSSVMVILGNLLADLALMVIDPRVEEDER